MALGKKTRKTRKTRKNNTKINRKRYLKKGGIGKRFIFDYLPGSAGKAFYRNQEKRIYSNYLNGGPDTSESNKLSLSPLHRALRKLSQNMSLTLEEIQLIKDFVNNCQGLDPAYCEERKILLLKIREKTGEPLNDNERQKLASSSVTHIYVYP
jgi:hypothetical protein